MRKQEPGYDYRRYLKLLAEAVDERKRLALIELLIEEKAKRQLEAERMADRDVVTAATIAGILGKSRNAA